MIFLLLLYIYCGKPLSCIYEVFLLIFSFFLSLSLSLFLSTNQYLIIKQDWALIIQTLSRDAIGLATLHTKLESSIVYSLVRVFALSIDRRVTRWRTLQRSWFFYSHSLRQRYTKARRPRSLGVRCQRNSHPSSLLHVSATDTIIFNDLYSCRCVRWWDSSDSRLSSSSFRCGLRWWSASFCKLMKTSLLVLFSFS